MYNDSSINIKHHSKKNSNVLWFDDTHGLILSFVIPVVIMLIILIQRKIFPFGENSFMRTDMYHQYVPFFSEFRYKLTTGQSLLYSWDVGMGVNFPALYAYYLASPLNWLVVLCPENSIIEFVTGMIIFKIGLCGLSFSYYLKKHSKNPGFGIVFFGIFYALSGYMAAYNWNIMWLDCIVLFPMVCLGLENIVNKKSGLLYVISLGICICSNYYISIMICMFMIIYYIMLLILKGKQSISDFIRSALSFGIYSICAGGMSAAILLPEIYALRHTASGEFDFPDVFNSYFSIFDMFARHMGNVEIEIGLDHWPNIYCGVAVIMFMFLYLNNAEIKLKEKAVYITAAVFMLAGFSINVLDYMWHGLHFPNSLPARQSFIYIFLVLFMSYRVYDKLGANTLKQVGRAFLMSMAFILLCQKLVPEEENFHFIVYYGAMIFTALYALIIYLSKQGFVNPNIILFAAFTIVSIEAAVNTVITSVATTSRSAYTDDNADIKNLVKEIKAEDKDFYRFDKTARKTKNDGAWLNFHSASIFSSTANADLTDFLKSIGCEASTNAYSINGATPLVDSLLSIKYAMYQLQPSNPELRYISISGTTYLYENPFVLPLGYMLPDNFEENWLLDAPNPADVQNDISEVLQVPPVLDRVDGEIAGNTYTFTPDIKGIYYVYINNRNIKDVEVKTSDTGEPREFNDVNRGYLIELGNCEAGVDVTLSTDETDKVMDAIVYRFNYNALREIYNIFSQNPMTIVRYTSRRVTGSINAPQAGVMMTSIPYDSGWKIRVDGKLQSARKGYNAFISLNLAQGEHTIDMVYEPEGLRMGWAVTLASLFVIICSVAGSRVIKSFNKEDAALKRFFARNNINHEFLKKDMISDIEDSARKLVNKEPSIQNAATKNADDVDSDFEILDFDDFDDGNSNDDGDSNDNGDSNDYDSN